MTKYTPKHEARLREVAERAGGLNLDIARAIAQEDDFVAAGITAKGIISFARTRGIPWQIPSEVDANKQPSFEELGLKEPPSNKTTNKSGVSEFFDWKMRLSLLVIAVAVIVWIFVPDVPESAGGSCRAQLESCLDSQPESRWENYCQPRYYRCLRN